MPDRRDKDVRRIAGDFAIVIERDVPRLSVGNDERALIVVDRTADQRMPLKNLERFQDGRARIISVIRMKRSACGREKQGFRRPRRYGGAGPDP